MKEIRIPLDVILDEYHQSPQVPSLASQEEGEVVFMDESDLVVAEEIAEEVLDECDEAVVFADPDERGDMDVLPVAEEFVRFDDLMEVVMDEEVAEAVVEVEEEEAIAKVILFLCSPDAEVIHGAAIPVYGRV